MEESSLELPPPRRLWKTKTSMCRVRYGDATETQGKVFDLKEAWRKEISPGRAWPLQT